MFQVSRAVKHEIQAWLPFDDSWSTIASSNHHRTHFGGAWAIATEDGTPAHGCCMAFGIDRWVHAVVVQHGTSVESWPAPLRSMISR